MVLARALHRKMEADRIREANEYDKAIRKDVLQRLENAGAQLTEDQIRAAMENAETPKPDGE